MKEEERRKKKKKKETLERWPHLPLTQSSSPAVIIQKPQSSCSDSTHGSSSFSSSLYLTCTRGEILPPPPRLSFGEQRTTTRPTTSYRLREPIFAQSHPRIWPETRDPLQTSFTAAFLTCSTSFGIDPHSDWLQISVHITFKVQICKFGFFRKSSSVFRSISSKLR